MAPAALLFDLNGTMIDDMKFHLDVWFDIITKDLGSTLTKGEVKDHMYGKNEEVLLRIFGETRCREFDFDAITRAKEERYQKIYKPHLALLPGLGQILITSKEKNLKMAIGSAAPRFNIDFVLDNLNLHDYFLAVVSADDVVKSKPDPEVFLKAADILGVHPSSCIVFEDSPKGVEAANNAGMKCIAVTTMHRPNEFEGLKNILIYIRDFTDPRLSGILF